MQKKSFLVLISILSLTVSSCTYMKSFSEKRQELEETSKPTIKVKAGAKGKTDENTEEKDPLAEALEDAETLKREQDIVGLIKPTNPEIRVRGSVRGRPDPFSTVAVKPQIEIEVEEEEEESTNRFSRNQRNPVNNEVERPETITSTPTIEDLESEEIGSVTPLADSVLISGLVELGDRIKLIVQAPGEATSRYVDIGQYISDGKVLVKRIESSFPVPTVILEESGVEVSRVIGQQVEEEIEEQATLPSPPPVTPKSISWLSNYLSQNTTKATTK